MQENQNAYSSSKPQSIRLNHNSIKNLSILSGGGSTKNEIIQKSPSILAYRNNKTHSAVFRALPRTADNGQNFMPQSYDN